jgi:hypothetical protein
MGEDKPVLKMYGTLEPMWKSTEDKITPMTPEMIEDFKKRVVDFVEARRAMQTHGGFCPTPGCTAGSGETGRVCSKLPHTSLSPEFLEDSDTVTIEGKPLC